MVKKIWQVTCTSRKYSLPVQTKNNQKNFLTLCMKPDTTIVMNII